MMMMKKKNSFDHVRCIEATSKNYLPRKLVDMVDVSSESTTRTICAWHVLWSLPEADYTRTIRLKVSCVLIIFIHYFNFTITLSAAKLYHVVRQGDRNRLTKQKKMAQELMQCLGNHTGPCSLGELRLLHASSYLKDYRIQVSCFTVFVVLLFQVELFSGIVHGC